MRHEPIDHPSVWRGPELLARSDWRHELTAAERGEIERALEGGELSTAAPAFCQRLAGFQHSLEHGCGAALIQGLELGDRSVETLSAWFQQVGSVLGTPISQSAQGEIIFSVRDAGYGDQDPRTRGPVTNKQLSFHTDRCDVIGFLCVQQAKSGGENQVVSSPALYNEILRRRPDLLEVLMQPYYLQRHNVDSGNELPFTRQPVFSFYEGHFAANFLRVLIERADADPQLPNITPIQREALDFLEEVAAEPGMHLAFRQEPGDILLSNNWVTFHRRTAFEDYDEPRRRRHILRIWLSVPNSRPLDPIFAGHYGCTEAGAIRGGMRAAT